MLPRGASAIRLAENCYPVTGDAIKLTQDMKRAHLHDEHYARNDIEPRRCFGNSDNGSTIKKQVPAQKEEISSLKYYKETPYFLS